MRKIILFFLLLGFISLTDVYSYEGEYNRFEIRYGMHERVVNKRYGEPILVKKIRVHPIPKKKALYEIGESNYMILYFFSGRINKITLLEDMGLDEATSIFEKNQL